MREDEVNQFEKRWKEIYDKALNPLFSDSKKRTKSNFDKNLFTKLYT